MLSYNVLNSWVEKMMKKSLPVKIKTSDITNLSTKDINKLKAGDIVLKKTGNQKHAYIVSYKEDNQGICLTYNDALYTETVSYDYTDGAWVYNSTDKTVIQKELTAGDNITITDAGVISATDTTYTAGENITIENGVISGVASTPILYRHDITLGYSGSSSSCNVVLTLILPTNVAFTKNNTNNTLAEFLKRNLDGVPIMCSGEEYPNDHSALFTVSSIKNSGDAGFTLSRFNLTTGVENTFDFSGTGANCFMQDRVSGNIFNMA